MAAFTLTRFSIKWWGKRTEQIRADDVLSMLGGRGTSVQDEEAPAACTKGSPGPCGLLIGLLIA